MRRGLWPNLPAVLFVTLAFWGVLPTATVATEEPPSEPNTASATPIVGGKPADIDQYPWVVYLADSRGEQFCGGALIAPDKVLTAAHCVVDRRAPRVSVVAGRADKNSRQGRVLGVTDSWVHPDYSTPYRGADVAVLTLRETTSRSVVKLAAPSDDGLYGDNTEATVLGWGARSEEGQNSDVLRRAMVPVVGDAECAKIYDRQFVPNAMVCAGHPDGGVDACQGDSGGPLVVGNKIIGIVSWGVGCARPGKPGVYTEVAAYAERIRARF
ncbi:Trypsin [Actinopolyspora mzabensis]|uniref:Trypsin n=1 Tax=Actinopolyspora mzabensis TaxID=995066 RepID=A0A1G8YRP9_ACTMZ|nr:serine protease [Actinopolyspora mzabensis]SDK05417.1 Trypsin [Actinopolyspora mzabensis]